MRNCITILLSLLMVATPAFASGNVFKMVRGRSRAPIITNRGDTKGTLIGQFKLRHGSYNKYGFSYSISCPRRRNYDRLIYLEAKRRGLEPALVKAVVHAESAFNACARSPKGAMGLMQLMPQTARELGVRNPYEPAQNIRGGVKYLAQLMDRYNGNLSLSLAAYNAGPGAVSKHSGIPPYSETRAYVRRVLQLRAKYLS